MATHPERTSLTYADYRQLPDDRQRYELLEGELAVTPAPGTGHQIVVSNVQFLLESHVRRYRLGKVLAAPCDVLLSNSVVVQPDLLFISSERLSIIRPHYVRGAPDLVVEVISPGTTRRDRQVKARIYARYGVPHYWLLDPRRQEAVAHVLAEGVYQQAAAAGAKESFAAPPVPELAISLAALWE